MVEVPWVGEDTLDQAEESPYWEGEHQEVVDLVVEGGHTGAACAVGFLVADTGLTEGGVGKEGCGLDLAVGALAVHLLALGGAERKGAAEGQDGAER